MPQIDFALVFAALEWFLYGSLAVYILVAFGLTMLAARLEMRGGWMAWIPVLNLFLLCRLARASWVFALFAMTPIAGLLVLAYLGARVARRLGMPGAVGALFGVPFLGALVPIPMALGRAPLPEGSTGGAATRSPLAAGAISVAIATVLATAGVSAFWMTGGTAKAAPPAKAVAAKLPKTTSSTLTEFPIDTATTNAARPTNVVTQSFERPKKGQPYAGTVKIPPRQLPAWMAPESLPAVAESVAAADYVSAGSNVPVSVVTMVAWDTQSPISVPPTRAQLAVLHTDARATGVEVTNAEGETYRGYRVSGGPSTHYALHKTGTNVHVLISASDAAGADTAKRLAENMGIGDGLLQDESYASIFGELPSAPGGAAWNETGTLTESDIEQLVQMAEHEVANMSEADKSELQAFMPLITQLRTFAPKRVGFAYSFNELNTQGYGAAVASYGSARSTWLVFKAAEMVRTLVPIPSEVVLRPATIGGASGYFVSATGAGSAFILRDGGSIVGFAAAGEVTEEELRAWAAAHLAPR